jgi:hypothetical protein
MSKKSALALALFVLALTPAAQAEDPRFGPNDIRTLFVIGKNIDRNEVHYGIRLDKDCVPVGNEPLYAYWRQVERGPNITEDLNFLDRTVYGIKEQKIVKRSPDESKILMTLKATSDRMVAVITHRRDGKCVAESIATINGKPARVERVFVHVPGFMRVDWIEIRGLDVATEKPVVERVNR